MLRRVFANLVCVCVSCSQPKYKEAGTYVVKYRMCLSRAMQLMKTYVTNAFQTATQQVIDSKLASVAGKYDRALNIPYFLYTCRFLNIYFEFFVRFTTITNHIFFSFF